jgi:large exoprotein involved in heme utilization and adhesion
MRLASPHSRRLALGIFVLIGLAASSGGAESLIATDGSLGSGAVEVGPGVDPTGQMVNYLITGDLGALRGDNLFHSFARFGIGLGETATFTGPDDVQT